jgi:hypothetical protein
VEIIKAHIKLYIRREGSNATNQGTSFGGLLGKIMAEIEMCAPSFPAITREVNLERAKPSSKKQQNIVEQLFGQQLQ